MTANALKSGLPEYNERADRDFRVCMVAVVEEVGELCVNVRPAFKERVIAENGREIIFEEMQLLEEVPIADVAGIRKIPEVGDHGLILYHDFDVQEYIETRETSDLETPRFHDYSDALFLPFEFAKVDRPDPYITLECDKVTIHKATVLEKDVVIQGNICGEGDLTIDGNISAKSDLTVSGKLSVQSDLIVSGNANFGKSVKVAGNIATEGSLKLEGNAEIEGDIAANGNINATGDVGAANIAATGNIGAGGDISAGGGTVSLNNLNQAFLLHQHISGPAGSFGTTPTPPPVTTGSGVTAGTSGAVGTTTDAEAAKPAQGCEIPECD